MQAARGGGRVRLLREGGRWQLGCRATGRQGLALRDGPSFHMSLVLFALHVHHQLVLAGGIDAAHRAEEGRLIWLLAAHPATCLNLHQQV